MDLLIFHYHFLPGGVTDVVTSSAVAFLNYSMYISTIKIICGRKDNLDKILRKIKEAIPDEKKERISIDVLPSIDYFDNIDGGTNSEIIRKELINRYSSGDSLWWIHNYQLGKNPYFTKALIDISKNTDQKIIYHIHDFPECSRYKLLDSLNHIVKGDLYPQKDNIRYVVINKRDQNYLLNAGMQKEIVYLLENPINIVQFNTINHNTVLKKLSERAEKNFPQWQKNEKYMIYPVRAIRRKNVAEAALLSSLSGKNIILTLPGVSKREINYSNKCREIFTGSLAPGMFGIGLEIEDLGISFDQLVSASSLIISSSVQEGFGYLFLNSMNWGKPLIARDLDILSDFKDSFREYPSHFYNKLHIILEEKDKIELQDLYSQKLERIKKYLGKKTSKQLKKSFFNIINADSIDYSFLTLEIQIKILRKIKNDNKYRDKCMHMNSTIIEHINSFIEEEPEANHKILEENWSHKSYNRICEGIIQSFENKYNFPAQYKPEKTISETLQSYFADIQYLRLLYDE